METVKGKTDLTELAQRAKIGVICLVIMALVLAEIAQKLEAISSGD